MSNVRTATRWIIIRTDDDSEVELDLLQLADGRFIIMDEELTFWGDLLAVETLAKLHRGIAYPVEGLDGNPLVVQLVPEGSAPIQGDADPLGGVTPDVPNEPSSVEVPVEEPSTEPTPEDCKVPADVGGAPKAVKPGPPVPPKPERFRTTGESGVALPKPEEPPTEVRAHPEPGGAADSRYLPGAIQGGGGGDGRRDILSNPYHVYPGSGVNMKPRRSLLHVKDPTWYHFQALRMKRQSAPYPSVLSRDLGYCMEGMPRWVGTTIVGRLRPDTGGVDPPVPDHVKWKEYGLPFGR